MLNQYYPGNDGQPDQNDVTDCTLIVRSSYCLYTRLSIAGYS